MLLMFFSHHFLLFVFRMLTSCRFSSLSSLPRRDVLTLNPRFGFISVLVFIKFFKSFFTKIAWLWACCFFFSFKIKVKFKKVFNIEGFRIQQMYQPSKFQLPRTKWWKKITKESLAKLSDLISWVLLPRVNSSQRVMQRSQTHQIKPTLKDQSVGECLCQT